MSAITDQRLTIERGAYMAAVLLVIKLSLARRSCWNLAGLLCVDAPRQVGTNAGLSELPTHDVSRGGSFPERPCFETRKREFKHPWHEAGQLNHRDDKLHTDQQVVNTTCWFGSVGCTSTSL